MRRGGVKFEKIADGSFYVVSSITWQVANRYFPEGGGLMYKLDVRGGEVKEIVLAP